MTKRSRHWITLAFVLIASTWALEVAAEPPNLPTTKPSTKSQVPPTPKGATLSPKVVQRLLTCAMSRRFGTYQSTQKTIPLRGRRLGMFTSGWDTLLFVFKVPYCIARITGKRAGSRAASLSLLSNLPLFGPKQQSQTPSPWRNHYNPALLSWLTQYIPSPSDKFAGVTFQKIYNYSLQRIIRINAYTYLYLQEGKGKQLYQAYAKLHTKPTGATGRASLEQRLRQKALRNKINKGLKHLVRDSSIVGSYIEYSPGEAAVFLMRRMMGGTAPALWALLKQILDRYDPAFLPRATKKRPLGVIDLWVAKKKAYKNSVWDASQVEQIGIFLSKAPPYTKIQLKPGTYRINASWTIKKAHHITFEGIGKGKVDIVSTALADTVLSIQDSHDIRVRNLHMRHTKASSTDTCSGQVIHINDSHRIWIDRNELNGSGTVGVAALSSRDVVITRNYIHSNTRAGIDLFMVKSISVMYNKIINNAAGVLCHKCTLSMGQNLIQNNKVGSLHGRAFATQILKRIKGKAKKK